MNLNNISASAVVSTRDLQIGTQRDVTEIVSRFLALGEGVIAHWVEYAKGVLLFVMAPGDDLSGEFYIYDRKSGRFWLLALADGIFGGYAIGDMPQKIREFDLLPLAENPTRISTLQ